MSNCMRTRQMFKGGPKNPRTNLEHIFLSFDLKHLKKNFVF